MRAPRLGTWVAVSSERDAFAPANLVHPRDLWPARPLQRERVWAPESAVPAREERVCKLDFLPHLDSRDELCLPSRRVVSITLAQLWLGLAACHYFANQKADVAFIFSK